jgi:hypothetical protein
MNLGKIIYPRKPQKARKMRYQAVDCMGAGSRALQGAIAEDSCPKDEWQNRFYFVFFVDEPPFLR